MARYVFGLLAVIACSGAAAQEEPTVAQYVAALRYGACRWSQVDWVAETWEKLMRFRPTAELRRGLAYLLPRLMLEKARLSEPGTDRALLARAIALFRLGQRCAVARSERLDASEGLVEACAEYARLRGAELASLRDPARQRRVLAEVEAAIALGLRTHATARRDLGDGRDLPDLARRLDDFRAMLLVEWARAVPAERKRRAREAILVLRRWEGTCDGDPDADPTSCFREAAERGECAALLGNVDAAIDALLGNVETISEVILDRDNPCSLSLETMRHLLLHAERWQRRVEILAVTEEHRARAREATGMLRAARRRLGS